MTEDIKLCMGCMAEKDYDGDCKLCGYSEKSPYLPSYLAPGTLLNDRYIAGKMLSYNGEGAIYIAFDKVTKTKVTIKEYMPDTLCSRKKDAETITVDQNQMPLYKTYLQEFVELNKSLMKSRGMTHIQTVLDIFPQNNTAYVVFEYIVGISLKTFLANCAGELSWEQIKELFPPILTTLSLVHSAGITHRGISPQTIMVTDKMQLKLIGFEISAARTTNTEIACEMYPGYAAPEQYSQNEWHGPWTDVYGICAVLYRALTGCVPSESIARTGNDSLVEPMMINRNVPANVSAVIMNGMKLQTSERIQNINALVEKLFEQPKFNGVQQNQQRTAPIKEQAPKAEVKQTAAKKKKKQASTNQKAAMITIIASLVIILGFMIAIFVMPMLDKNEESSSQPATTTKAETTAPVTTADTALTTASADESIEETFVVPDFTNRPYSTVQDNSKYSFLSIKAVYEFNDDYGNGMIFKQNVDAEKEVKTGTAITLTISKGSKTVKLPDYDGVKLDDYLAKLSALNIKYETKTTTSDKVSPGYIVKCSKKVGDAVKVADGETVTVYYVKKSTTASNS